MIFSLVVTPNSHLLQVWSLSGSQGIPTWLQSSFIVPRYLPKWLYVVALVESELEVEIPECTFPFDVTHGLDVLTSL